MQEKQNRVFFILGSLLVTGLLALSLLDPPKSDESKKWTKQHDVERDAVRKAVIETGSKTYAIGKAGGRWTFEEGDEGLADEAELQKWMTKQKLWI